LPESFFTYGTPAVVPLTAGVLNGVPWTLNSAPSPPVRCRPLVLIQPLKR